jgi:uncharacterized peroxidase-related enzyme
MFLTEPPESDERKAVYAAEREEDGYVSNHTRLWCWRPDLDKAFYALRSGLMQTSALTDREWAVLVTSTAAAIGDSYCTLAWGPRLAALCDEQTASQVLAQERAPALTEREAALAAWARQVVRDPNATTEQDVGRLRELGLGDREIFEATAFIAFRLAFSTVNDALGAAPDQELAAAAPDAVRAAVTYGRPPA